MTLMILCGLRGCDVMADCELCMMVWDIDSDGLMIWNGMIAMDLFDIVPLLRMIPWPIATMYSVVPFKV